MSINFRLDNQSEKKITKALEGIAASATDEDLDEMVAEGVFDPIDKELTEEDRALAERTRQVLLESLDRWETSTRDQAPVLDAALDARGPSDTQPIKNIAPRISPPRSSTG